MRQALFPPAVRPVSRSHLVALNAGLLSRAAICKLALEWPRWRTLRSTDEAAIAARAERLGVGRDQLRRALDLLPSAEPIAEREQARAAELGARILTLGDEDYPRPLLDLSLPPPVLYCRGELPTGPAVAIVGSRRADAYGLEAAELFARELACLGLTVVSGFARGVDTAAHRGALAAGGGLTVAVLGCGLDIDYPRGSSRLASQVAAAGALISEFPLGTPPEGRNFPVRNRVIAALAAGTLVVRAAPRSGSLITARLALELGRDVWAVPGGIFDRRARGTNLLIQDGALPALRPADVVESLPWRLRERLPAGDPAPAAPGPRPAGAAAELLEALPPGELLSQEQVAGRCGLPLDRVLSLLLELELGGWVRRYPGASYMRRP